MSEVMQDNFEKVVNRGENLDEVQEKAGIVLPASIIFS